MTPVTGANLNCWAACLATILDLPYKDVAWCSTETNNWRESSQELLADHDLFFVEVMFDPHSSHTLERFTTPPHGAIVILGTDTEAGKHCMLVKCHVREYSPTHDEVMYDIVYDPDNCDPSGDSSQKRRILPSSIFFLCRLFK